MKHHIDLLSALTLAFLSLVWLFVPVLSQYPYYLAPYALLFLILPGFALLNFIKPDICHSKIMVKFIYSLNLSVLISLLVFLLFLYKDLNALNIPQSLMMAFISIFLTLAAILRRKLYNPGQPSPLDDVLDEAAGEYSSTQSESMDDLAVKVENVGMEFNLSKEKVDNIKEYVIKLMKRELLYQEFWALRDISFEVKKGDKLGIIGLNGAGKSTILKLISGVMKPTIGKIQVNGGVVPLLELGGGFDSNYTGRENIYLRGALLGYSKEFMESKFDEIVEFSELEDFIDVPIKNYSSGMKSRLGFSISTVVQPKILILDEVLAAGDVKFRKKSQDRMNSMLNKDTTVILVSHSMAQIKNLCNKAIWLEKGRLIMEGTADEVCDRYMEKSKQDA